mmetsp:Transcript_22457/g.53375  ORF Transcript_22457/g.53375 Transcript_22457/m.53375 type:complete len:259 (-) Transcript_22457:83-859(-)
MKFVRFDPHLSYITAAAPSDSPPTSTWLSGRDYEEIRRKLVKTVCLMEVITSERKWNGMFPHLCRRGLEECVYDYRGNELRNHPRIGSRREEASRAVLDEQRSLLRRRSVCSAEERQREEPRVDGVNAGNANGRRENDRWESQPEARRSDPRRRRNPRSRRQQPDNDESGVRNDDREADALRRACDNRANVMASVERGLKDGREAAVVYLEDRQKLISLWKNSHAILSRNYNMLFKRHPSPPPRLFRLDDQEIRRTSP